MPHTNRKKGAQSGPQASQSSKSAYVKRHVVEADDGWTHVVGGRKTAAKAGRSSTVNKQAPGDFSLNGHQYVDVTLEEIKADFQRYRQQWEESSACSELKNILGRHIESLDQIDNVVSLGLSSFQHMSRDLRQRTHCQLAALETIIGLKKSSLVRKIAQDPAFTKLDHQFLTARGFTVVENPDAFSKIDEKSLVYAIHCYPDVYQSIGDTSFPSLYIGNDLEYNQQLNMTPGDQREKTLENLRRSYDAIASFPQLRYDFSDTKIYLRKSSKEPPS